MSSLEDNVFRGGKSGHDAFRDELMAKNARIALVTYDWNRQVGRHITTYFPHLLLINCLFFVQNPRELSVSKGEYLHVLDDERKWWKCRNEDGEVGFVPSTMVKAIIYTDVRGEF